MKQHQFLLAPRLRLARPVRANHQTSATSRYAFLLSSRLSTTLPLVGKKFIEYRIGQNTGTVYCRVYMAKSEVDEHMMDRLVQLSQDLIDTAIKDQLTASLAGHGTVSADIQSLTLFHEQQLRRAQAENRGNRN